jgi:sec-independent protein translocase protein TatA
MVLPDLSLAFIESIGGPEMMLVFLIVLVLFGGKKLPEFARGAGKAIREFKKAASGVEEEFKRALEEEDKKTAPTPAIAPVTTPAPALPPPATVTAAPQPPAPASPASPTPPPPASEHPDVYS